MELFRAYKARIRMGEEFSAQREGFVTNYLMGQLRDIAEAVKSTAGMEGGTSWGSRESAMMWLLIARQLRALNPFATAVKTDFVSDLEKEIDELSKVLEEGPLRITPA